jgi:hypothetical protein
MNRRTGAAASQKLRRLPEPITPTAPNTTFKLVAQTKSCDQCAISLRAFLAQIGQKSTALTNHHHETTARMQVMLVNLKMFSQLIDTPGQDRYLHLWRTCIGLVNAGIGDDFRLFFDT